MAARGARAASGRDAAHRCIDRLCQAKSGHLRCSKKQCYSITSRAFLVIDAPPFFAAIATRRLAAAM
jgi:hypothetical protein